MIDLCPVCGSKNHYPIFSKYSPGSEHDFLFHKCGQCDLVFVLNPVYKNYYSKKYFQGKGQDQLVNYEYEVDNPGIRLTEFEGLLDIIKSFHDKNNLKIFDYGCGSGSLLHYLKHNTSYELYGYDKYFRIHKPDKRIHYYSGIQKALKYCGNKMDVVLAIEVIEHLSTPRLFAREVHKLLKTKGVFIYTTGNASSIYAKLTGKSWSYLLPEIHLMYYSPKTIRILFKRYSMKVSNNKYNEAFRKIILYKYLKNKPLFENNPFYYFTGKSPKLLNWLNGISDFPFFIKESK